MVPRIVIKTDVGNRIGTGHLIESLTLFTVLRKHMPDWTCELLLSDKAWYHKLKAKGVQVFLLAEGGMSEDIDVEATRRHLASSPHTVLVCDQFERSSRYYNHLCDNNWRTLIILDHHRIQRLCANVIVNFNICQDPIAYEGREQTKYYIGPQYMIMSSEIIAKPRVRIRNKIRRTLISMGGSDPFNLTSKIIQSISNKKFPEEFVVVMGPEMKQEHKKVVRTAFSNYSGKMLLRDSLTHQDMVDLIATCDLAITSPGNTLYELSFLGIPSLVISHHLRHKRVANSFAALGAIHNLGIGSRLTQDSIASDYSAVRANLKYRQHLQHKAISISDGGGCGRICSLIQQLAIGDGLTNL